MVSPRLAGSAIAGTALYLGLAVVAGGGALTVFSHPALIALAVVTVALTVASLFSSANLSAGLREDSANRWVLAAFMLLGFLSAWVPAYADRREIWTMDGESLRWVGVCLFAVGGVLRLWPVFVLGRRFSGLVAIQPGHQLVTGGIYRHIRHPSYLGLIVMGFGWALAFRSLIGVFLAALTIVPLVARMRAEDAMLEREFGGVYSAYRARTARLIPGLY